MNEYLDRRTELGLSHRTLAMKSGVDARSIKKLEEGGVVKAATIARLRAYLRLPMASVNPLVAMMEERQVGSGELAEQLGVIPHQLHNWRSGAGRIPRRFAVSICEILGQPFARLEPLLCEDQMDADTIRQSVMDDTRSVREIAAATGLKPTTVQQLRSGLRKRTGVKVVRALLNQETQP